MSAYEILEAGKKYRKREYHIFFRTELELDYILRKCELEQVIKVYALNDVLIPFGKVSDNKLWKFNIILITEQESDMLMEKISKSSNVHLIDSAQLELLNMKPSDMLNKLITEYEKENMYLDEVNKLVFGNKCPFLLNY